MPRGRPTDYTEEITIAICNRLSVGESLNEICKDAEMPDKSTVFRWIGRHPEFNDKYAKAKVVGIEALAEDLLDIADNSANDWMTKNDPDNPGFLLNGDSVQRSRLRIDTRKWILSKLAAKKYGEKVDHTIDGTLAHKHTVEQLPETDSWIESIIGSGEETKDPSTRTH